MPRSVLVLFDRFPFEAAAGPALRLDEIARTLADASFGVFAAGVTASETPRNIAETVSVLEAQGFTASIDRQPSAADGRPLIRFRDGDAGYRLIDVGDLTIDQWPERFLPTLDRLAVRIVRETRADLLLIAAPAQSLTPLALRLHRKGMHIVLFVADAAALSATSDELLGATAAVLAADRGAIDAARARCPSTALHLIEDAPSRSEEVVALLRELGQSD